VTASAGIAVVVQSLLPTYRETDGAVELREVLRDANLPERLARDGTDEVVDEIVRLAGIAA
jgi:hypothetical protein